MYIYIHIGGELQLYAHPKGSVSYPDNSTTCAPLATSVISTNSGYLYYLYKRTYPATPAFPVAEHVNPATCKFYCFRLPDLLVAAAFFKFAAAFLAAALEGLLEMPSSSFSSSSFSPTSSSLSSVSSLSSPLFSPLFSPWCSPLTSFLLSLLPSPMSVFPSSSLPSTVLTCFPSALSFCFSSAWTLSTSTCSSDAEPDCLTPMGSSFRVTGSEASGSLLSVDKC
mmetsp:Transcript_30933/g.55557  ORF Transcript_30933/g.55557 Transcript_30933/m.55557 type:complete len:224 (+) Transcript_30933:545-1216(+)